MYKGEKKEKKNEIMNIKNVIYGGEEGCLL